MSYLYATQFNNSDRVHNLNILYVDYDGGVIGQSVMKAYQALEGNDFPTLYTEPAGQYSTPADIKGAVCSGHFWTAIYTSPNAAASPGAQLANGTTSSNTALTYVWNGARYPAFAQREIYSNKLVLIHAARAAYYASSSPDLLGSTDLSNPVALETFLDPIPASGINIKTTVEGTRVL